MPNNINISIHYQTVEGKYNSRINYHGKLEDISRTMCKNLDIGDFVANELILTGYEDYNFILETTKNKYFVKIFARFRTMKDCERYLNVMINVIRSKIKTPKLIQSKSSFLKTLEVNNAHLRFCLLEYLNGKDLFNLNETLDINEIKWVVQQATMINSADIKPSFIYDSWAITNFKKEFEKKAKYLSLDDLSMLQPLIKEFDHLKIHELPHCFVHGDLVSTNIMKDDNDELWVIDFSVSNYYPRIQELSVLASDILFDPKSKTESEKRLKIALQEYQKKIPLTKMELNALPIYIKIAFAMHILLTNYEKIVNNNTSRETEHFLQLGRIGLKHMIQS